LDKRLVRVGLAGWATLLGALVFLPTLQAGPYHDDANDLRRRAKELAQKGQWTQAFDVYLQIPKNDRDKAEYQDYLRHALQARRLRDRPAQAVIGQLPADQALTVYLTVLDKLQRRYVDRGKVTLGRMFLNGVQELRTALEDEAFLKEHGLKAQALDALKDRLKELRDKEPELRTSKEACDQLQGVMLVCRPLGLKPAAVMLEFVCGACNTLDEYTAYLSPRQLLEIEADLNGKYVGIGVDLGVSEQKLVITRVLPNGPAWLANLQPGTRILTIDGQAVDEAAPAAAAGRLLGDEGSEVQLEVAYAGGKSRVVTLKRRPIEMQSVEQGRGMPEYPGLGYVRIAFFQKTTPEELRSQILWLQSQMAQMGGPGLQKLVLDLRGNPGGSFPAALQVAEMFLPEGVICYTRTRQKEEAYRANNPQAFLMPLVLLVDGDTASAAEVVAGALKENGRATLVGQATYGKCSIQCVIRLETIKSGIQLTVARFASPAHDSYDGHGVVPHQLAERDPMDDRQLALALAVAKQLPLPPMSMR
jgi:carboxyl-terminal processing protease